MALSVDAEYEAAVAAAMHGLPKAQALPVGDVGGRRTALKAIQHRIAALHPMPSDVDVDDFHIQAEDGSLLLLRWYNKRGAEPGPAALYVHGGGMILGSVDLYSGLVAKYVSLSSVPMLAVEYRLAPEHPYPAAVEDVYAALVWLTQHAAELEINTTRLAVMGDSAGGGLAVAAALLARDRRGPALARQILIYPMLDDRTAQPDVELRRHLTWSHDDNLTGWRALLGHIPPRDVPSYAAPARAADLTGLPATYLEVGQLDLFRDEALAFVHRLCRAGTDVEFHLRLGVPHDFDIFAWKTGVTQRAVTDRVRVLRSL
ncbi:alpha/beta hydrolase [uncultured Jatrophihabitans sp.]|uniref:alpha/beta hydrolase n=1 Tax=uncultured Jatrophihabitans sp. TaxID=1610747 RepID=UPI0035CB5991